MAEECYLFLFWCEDWRRVGRIARVIFTLHPREAVRREWDQGGGSSPWEPDAWEVGRHEKKLIMKDWEQGKEAGRPARRFCPCVVENQRKG